MPLNTIPESYEQSIKSLRETRKHADDLLVYDNTPHAKGHRLVARFIAGAADEIDAEDLLPDQPHPPRRSERDALVVQLVRYQGPAGVLVADEHLRRDPHIRILISTGFSAESDIASLLEGGVRGVVMKPYQGEQLFSKIREALNGA